MDYTDTELVKQGEGKVHLRLLLFVLFRDRYEKSNITQEVHGVSVADVVALAAYVLDYNGPISANLVELPSRMRTWIMTQHVALLGVANDDLSRDNYEIWLLKQTNRFGPWLGIRPLATPHPAPVPVAEQETDN